MQSITLGLGQSPKVLGARQRKKNWQTVKVCLNLCFLHLYKAIRSQRYIDRHQDVQRQIRIASHA